MGNLFDVGDEVFDFISNKSGIIKNIKSNIVCYPIETSWGAYYTIDGKYQIHDAAPRLYHSGTDIRIIPHKPKRYPWANIYTFYKNSYDVLTVPHASKQEALDNINKDIRTRDYNYITTIQLIPPEENPNA